MSVHGTSVFLEQPTRYGWRQNGGAFQERSWEGPKSGLVSFLGSSLPQGYSEYVVDEDGDLVTVRAIYTADIPERIGNPSDDGLIERNWELDGDDLETTLWAHPKMVAATAGDTVTESIQLRVLVDKILSGEVAEIPGTTDIDEMVKRLAAGTESYLESKYVLRKVETVRKNSSIRPSFANVNRVFNYATLISAEPSLSYQNLIQASGLTNLNWLKGTPRVRPTQDGLWQIEQEFKGAEKWDTWIYPAAS